MFPLTSSPVLFQHLPDTARRVAIAVCHLGRRYPRCPAAKQATRGGSCAPGARCVGECCLLAQLHDDDEATVATTTSTTIKSASLASLHLAEPTST